MARKRLFNQPHTFGQEGLLLSAIPGAPSERSHELTEKARTQTTELTQKARVRAEDILKRARKSEEEVASVELPITSDPEAPEAG